MKYWRPVVLAAFFLQVVALLSPVTSAEGAPEAEDSALPESGAVQARRAHLVIKRAPGWGKRGPVPTLTLVEDEEDDEDEDLNQVREWAESQKRAPGWGKRAPGWGKRAPGWGKRSSRFALDSEAADPGWGKRAPGWGKRAPGWGKRAPGWGKRAPGWGKRAPGWGKRAPGWGKRAPGWGKRSELSCEDIDDEINRYTDQVMKAEAEKLARCGNGLNGNEAQRK